MEHIEMELIEKENVLKENIKDITQLDEAILLIEDQQSALTAEREKIEEELMKSAQTNKEDIKIDKSELETKTYQKFIHKEGINGSESANGKFIVEISNYNTKY